MDGRESRAAENFEHAPAARKTASSVLTYFADSNRQDSCARIHKERSVQTKLPMLTDTSSGKTWKPA